MFDGSIGKLKKAPSFMDRTYDSLPLKKRTRLYMYPIGSDKNDIKEENSPSSIITVDEKCLEKPRK